MEKILPKDISDSIINLRNTAYEKKLAGDYIGAEKNYLLAWGSLPPPEYNWDTSQILLERISEFYLEWKKYSEAEKWALDIFRSNPSSNYHRPYLILGKIYFESKREDLAAQNLIKAFEMGGRRGFTGEDPKYLKFVQDQMNSSK